ncbi:MAG TPA: MipA/OmpV family protein [Bordetella sp.]
MKSTLRQRLRPLLALPLLVFLAHAHAQDSAGTHWGLGAGAGYREVPFNGGGARFGALPYFFFDNSWLHAEGTTLDLKLGSTHGLDFTLRGKYALEDRRTDSLAASLNGMDQRHGAFQIGPTVRWHSDLGIASAAFLVAGDKGQQLVLDYTKPFQYGAWTLSPYVGVRWLSDSYVDYYYGVRSSEARPGRPAYDGNSTYELSLGSRFRYQFTPHQSVMFDLGVARLGSGITDSPIVGRQYVPRASIGYLYQF